MKPAQTNLQRKQEQKTRAAGTGLTLVLILFFCVVVYAAVLHYFADTGEQNSKFSKDTLFAFEDVQFFGEELAVKPGDGISVNTALTSKSSIPMYVYLLIRMQDLGMDGPYTFTPSEDWSLLEEKVTKGTHTWVYACSKILSPMETAPALTSAFTMKDLSLDVFSEMTDDEVNLSIAAYGCDTEYGNPEAGWNKVRTHYELSY